MNGNNCLANKHLKVDLKDHCLLCYAKIPTPNIAPAQEIGEQLIKVLSEHLFLPPAVKPVGTGTSVVMWEHAIKATMCKICQSSAKVICQISAKRQSLIAQLKSRIVDLKTRIVIFNLSDMNFLVKTRKKSHINNSLKLSESFKGLVKSKVSNMENFAKDFFSQTTGVEAQAIVLNAPLYDILRYQRNPKISTEESVENITNGSQLTMLNSIPTPGSNLNRNLIRDLKDHPSVIVVELENYCTFCLNKISCKKRSAQNLKRKTAKEMCRLLISLLSRHLKLSPSVIFTRLVSERDTMNCTGWEDLIDGNLCSNCYDIADAIRKNSCELDHQNMLLKYNIEDYAQSIDFTDKDSTSLRNRSFLEMKWKEENVQLENCMALNELRRLIFSQAKKLKDLPWVEIYSLEENQGIPSHEDDPDYQREDIISQPEGMEANVTSTSTREYKVMRKVFKCRECPQKYFCREPLMCHYKEFHGKIEKTVSEEFHKSPDTIPRKRKQEDTEGQSAKFSCTCNICGLQCTFNSSLRAHVILAHEPNMQFCDDCDRGFVNRKLLRKHRKRVH